MVREALSSEVESTPHPRDEREHSSLDSASVPSAPLVVSAGSEVEVTSIVEVPVVAGQTGRTSDSAPSTGMCTSCGQHRSYTDHPLCSQCKKRQGYYYRYEKTTHLCSHCLKTRVGKDKAICSYCQSGRSVTGRLKTNMDKAKERRWVIQQMVARAGSQTQIAKKLGISRQRIWQIVHYDTVSPKTGKRR